MTRSRSSRCARSATASAMAPSGPAPTPPSGRVTHRRPAPTPGRDRTALAPGGVGRGGDADLYRDHLRGRLSRYRHPAASPDRPGDRGRRERALAHPHLLGCALPRWGRPGSHPLCPRSAVQRELHVAVRDRPRGGHEHQPPRALCPSAPDDGESAAVQAQENRLSRQLRERARRILDPAPSRRR